MIFLTSIVPFMLLLVVIFYRYVKRRNLEIALAEEKTYLAEMEKHRRQLYEKMQAEHRKRENEILGELNRQELKLLLQQPSTSSGVGGNNHAQFNVIDAANVDAVDDGDLTDDEFFEMPLPALPAQSPTAVSGQTSITDNEGIEAKTPSAIVYETPKAENVEHSQLFRFPSIPTRAPPPPPLQIPPQPTYLPPLPPRPNAASPSASSFPIVMNQNRISTHPTIIDVTPNSMLESEL